MTDPDPPLRDEDVDARFAAIVAGFHLLDPPDDRVVDTGAPDPEPLGAAATSRPPGEAADEPTGERSDRSDPAETPVRHATTDPDSDPRVARIPERTAEPEGPGVGTGAGEGFPVPGDGRPSGADVVRPGGAGDEERFEPGGASGPATGNPPRRGTGDEERSEPSGASEAATGNPPGRGTGDEKGSEPGDERVPRPQDFRTGGAINPPPLRPGHPLGTSPPRPLRPEQTPPWPVWRESTGPSIDEVLAAEEDEHFIPPPPRPLPPQEDLHFWGILAGLVGGPALLLWLVLIRPDVARWWTWLALALTIGGFVLLVMRQPRDRSQDDDHGAVV